MSCSASDVWSFGVVIYEMMQGGLPYPSLMNAEVTNLVCNGGTLDPPKRIESPELWAIALKCMQMDPEQRPTFHQLFNDLANLETQLSGTRTEDEYQNNDPPESTTYEDSTSIHYKKKEDLSAQGPQDGYGNAFVPQNTN